MKRFSYARPRPGLFNAEQTAYLNGLIGELEQHSMLNDRPPPVGWTVSDLSTNTNHTISATNTDVVVASQVLATLIQQMKQRGTLR